MDIYDRLAKHLAALGMGYPPKEELLEILKANFSPLEAEVALAIPSDRIPFDVVPASEIARHTTTGEPELSRTLTQLAARRLLFTKRLGSGEMGYALLQFGHGFPQTFFWEGTGGPLAEKMAQLIVKYSRKEQLRQAYGATPTKPFRYVPAASSIDPEEHAVFPFHVMEELLQKVNRFAVAHCPCRMTADLLKRRQCNHALEVCLKYDELAEYLIERGLGREVSREEAIRITRQCSEAGLVHMVDNAREGIKHTCNCCGCCCWSVSAIRRKAIPRDTLMATYFLRDTVKENCIGCGACADICPVKAITMEGDLPVVDREWCIGCGVCSPVCPSDAVVLFRRTDVPPPATFKELHEKIIKEKREGDR
jgi:ferredoxin